MFGASGPTHLERVMSKRQETLLSRSSSRLEYSSTTPETHHHQHQHHAKTNGCMSGIFKLLSKYQRRRKFLTFGRKQEIKSTVSSQEKEKPSAGTQTSLFQEACTSNKQEKKVTSPDIRRISCNMPRSPTLSQEIRLSNSPSTLHEKFQPPLAKMRTLEENKASPELAAETRRKLLGALEKCNEDLKALKQIIEAVRSAEQLRSPPPTAVKRVCCATGANAAYPMETSMGKKCVNVNNEQPSPVPMFDKFALSPVSSYSGGLTSGRMQQQKPQFRKKPGEDDIINLCLFNKAKTEPYTRTKCETTTALPVWRSKAMVESVEEVCNDIAWGENREVRRIGLVLQDYICRDLIEEIVRDQLGCYCMYPLPLEACKRRLHF